MATFAAPPIASSHSPVVKYPLPDIPTNVPGADPARSPKDAFRLAVAKFVGEVWDEDPAKIYAGVDTGESARSLG